MGEQAKREIEIGGGVGVRVERRGRVAVWTIDRPDRMNALSRAVVRELGRLAREAALDRELRAVVLTGAGDKAFCAGADLKERQSMDEEDVRDFLRSTAPPSAPSIASPSRSSPPSTASPSAAASSSRSPATSGWPPATRSSG
ncbi:MAG: enoyl-CoA hydratase-related protein [Sandaracinaceae bacterium]|nr:enoyl-CoA hydratase-related protein [Sandaracinaceae bacterium]